MRYSREMDVLCLWTRPLCENLPSKNSMASSTYTACRHKTRGETFRLLHSTVLMQPRLSWRQPWCRRERVLTDLEHRNDNARPEWGRFYVWGEILHKRYHTTYNKSTWTWLLGEECSNAFSRQVLERCIASKIDSRQLLSVAMLQRILKCLCWTSASWQSILPTWCSISSISFRFILSSSLVIKKDTRLWLVKIRNDVVWMWNRLRKCVKEMNEDQHRYERVPSCLELAIQRL